MVLTIIGSSSKGNAYVIQNGDEALVLEAGCAWRETMKALSFDVAKIQGVLVTHEHGDHAGHIDEPLAAAVPVYASKGTIGSLKLKGSRQPNEVQAGCLLTLGGFKVMPFATQHDAAEPLGYFIHHEEMGTLLFATDTYYIANTFAGLNHVLIECNYDTDILKDNIGAGRIPEVVAKRTLRSHMSVGNCIRTLKQNDLRSVRTIVLIHMSDNNVDAAKAVAAVSTATRRRTLEAKEGTTITINKNPMI